MESLRSPHSLSYSINVEHAASNQIQTGKKT
jgi:hypothetical protein